MSDRELAIKTDDDLDASVNDSVVVHSESGRATESSGSINDTSVQFDDTTELPSSVAQVATKKPEQRLATKQAKKIRHRSIRGRTRSAFAIQTEAAGQADEFSDPDESIWESTFRGMPSWLSSLILHLSLILLLALLTVGSDGRKIVDLLATASESVTIEPYTEFDIELNTEELESLADDSEFTDTTISESQDLSEMLDEAFLTADAPLDINSDLYDAVASESLEDLKPSRPVKGAAQFFGVEGAGSDFVYIVDCSGSMAEYGRWTSAVRELKSSINNLKSDQRFLILLYNTGFVAMNNKAELVTSTQAERKRAVRWLSRNSPNHWTFCAQALGKALSLKPDAIFLLSDGEFDDRRDVFQVLDQLNSKRRLISSNEKQIPVHTVALGSHHGRFTMKRIADENSGEFKLVQ